MSDNSIQPKRYDAVLGSSNSPALDSIVLGGVEGVKFLQAVVYMQLQLLQMEKQLLVLAPNHV